MLHELYVGMQVLQDLHLLDLEERVNAAWEEHVSSVRLSVQTRLLQHYRDHAAEVDEGSQLGLGSLVLVQLQQLLNCVLYPDRVDPCFFPCGKIQVLRLKEPLVDQGLPHVLLVEVCFFRVLEKVLVQIFHHTVFDSLTVEGDLLFLHLRRRGKGLNKLLSHVCH